MRFLVFDNTLVVFWNVLSVQITSYSFIQEKNHYFLQFYFSIQNLGATAKDYWIHTDKIPRHGARGIKVKAIKFGNENDKYFGFGVIEKSEIESDHGYYICFDHRKGKLLDIRSGSISGYDDNRIHFNLSSYSPYFEISILLNYNSNKFEFNFNGEKTVYLDINFPTADYVFAFDPYYKNTKFYFEFI